MDEMKIKLSSNLMKGFISRILSKIIQNQFGYVMDIQLNEIQVKIIDGKANLHIDADGSMESENFVKLIKTIGG